MYVWFHPTAKQEPEEEAEAREDKNLPKSEGKAHKQAARGHTRPL